MYCFIYSVIPVQHRVTLAQKYLRKQMLSKYTSVFASVWPSLACELQLLYTIGRTHVGQEPVIPRTYTQITQPQIVTETTLKCVFYLWLAGRHFKGAFFSSANKRSPSLLLEHSCVHGFKSIPVTTVSNSTFMYRFFKGSVRLPSYQ